MKLLLPLIFFIVNFFFSSSSNNRLGAGLDIGSKGSGIFFNYLFGNNKKNFDVIFIDGFHHYEQCRKDIINSLKVLNENGFILLHDMIPRSWIEENIPRLGTVWSGDVLSLIHI